MAFQLPDLPYDYNALEPHIDEKTMKVHHQKHHNGYTTKLNKAIEGTDLENKSIEQILRNVSKHSTAVRNNGGGFYNHGLFWNSMSPDGGGQPEEITRIHKGLEMAFGGFDQFKEQFKAAATGQFGSGWAWLCVDEPVGDLYICATPNQDNPIMDVNDFGGVPILGIDVWEHAYYLNYQNRRADYIDAFFKVINWKVIEERYLAARTQVATV
jgi:Fe-Mn family superoxide dismutase